jgi:hypothetical protein
LTTDAEGRYDVGNLILGRWRLTPNRRQDHLPGDPKELDLTTELREHAVELPLDPGLAVGGVVTDLSGNALPSARVTLSGVEDVGTPPAGVRRNGATDPSGFFRWTGFRSGRYTLVVRRGGFTEVRSSSAVARSARIAMSPSAPADGLLPRPGRPPPPPGLPAPSAGEPRPGPARRTFRSEGLNVPFGPCGANACADGVRADVARAGVEGCERRDGEHRIRHAM